MPQKNGKIIKCSECNKKMYKSLYFIENIKNPCCSYECKHKFYRRNKIKLKCDTCKKSFSKSKSAIKKYNYCSVECANGGFRKHSKEDIKNKKFNYLIPIKPIFQHGREWVWLCKCDCGNETNVRISKLKNNTTKSCGCLRAQNVISKSDGTNHKAWKGYKGLSKSFFSMMKNGAKVRGMKFNVTIKYLWHLFKEQKGLCAYTGKKILLPINQRKLTPENRESTASLDRIDNSKGYIKGNVHWTCKRVNYMKHTMGDEYFLGWVKSIYEFKKL